MSNVPTSETKANKTPGRLGLVLTRMRDQSVTRLRGYGNEIVPQVAAEFVLAYLDCERGIA